MTPSSSSPLLLTQLSVPPALPRPQSKLETYTTEGESAAALQGEQIDDRASFPLLEARHLPNSLIHTPASSSASYVAAMSAPSLPLVITLGLLVADATIELGFVTGMVSYLHSGAPSGVYVIKSPDGSGNTYNIFGKPKNVLVNQGHTSNGAAGTGIVLIGTVGVIALFTRRFIYRPSASTLQKFLGRFFYYTWVGLQVPALLLTIGALGYVFDVTNAHRGQTIDQGVAAALSTNTGVQGPYPLNTWTPQNWFQAVVTQLDFADPKLHADLVRHLRTMKGWQYNLIPLFLIQLAETVAALFDFVQWRRRMASGNHGNSTFALKA